MNIHVPNSVSSIFLCGLSHKRQSAHDKALEETSSWQGAGTPVRHDGSRLHPPRQGFIGEKRLYRALCFVLDLNAFA